MNTQLKTDVNIITAEHAFNTLINCYLRETTQWHKFFRIPKYDAGLSNYFKKVGHSEWIKIALDEAQVEIYCPVGYFSDTGRHLFNFPIVSRKAGDDEVKPLGLDDFFILISSGIATAENTQALYSRIKESIFNTCLIVNYALIEAHKDKPATGSFIAAEQSLWQGHTMHPTPKSRTGFSRKELKKYSPEFGNSFQLHYFLADPDIVFEKSVYEEAISARLLEELLAHPHTSEEVKVVIGHYPDKKLIPCHPWESQFLLKSPDVRALVNEKKLIHIGACGAYYSATSSVRTLYSEDSSFMLKCSLHVKITNSERVNLERELYRGYDISRLLHTSWGEGLQADFPNLTFISDPGFISLKNLNGETIEGFNTVIRTNQFKGKAGAAKRVYPVAAICQDALPGQVSPLAKLVKTFASKKDISIKDASLQWFQKYLKLTLMPFVGIYNQYGLACEAHQQNVLLELDTDGLPAHVYFRDNQGYYFREGKAQYIQELIPDLGLRSESVIPEAYINPKYAYYLIINNILGVINAFGLNRLAPERALLSMLYRLLKEIEASDTTGFVQYLLNSRTWSVKGNFMTNIANMDEARQPIANPAAYVDYFNPLLINEHFSSELIKPTQNQSCYRRHFPEKNITITIRPFDLDRDLETVHDWFNREHAKAFWRMDGPIRQLEAFYIMLLDSDFSHSFIGEINGTPTFTFEPYWPMRDVVGKYYDALPSDYGTHLMIGETDKDKKHTMECTQSLMEFIFNQPAVGKCIGEADVNAKSMHVVVTRLGFKLQRVLKMPHKTANLTFCTREWYRSKFPDCQIRTTGPMADTLNLV